MFESRLGHRAQYPDTGLVVQRQERPFLNSHQPRFHLSPPGISPGRGEGREAGSSHAPMRMRLLTIVAVSLMLMAPTKPPVDVARSIVAIRMPNDAGKMVTFCSGVVAQTVPVAFILTEAHCLDGEDVEKMRVEDKALVEVARSHELVLLRVQGWLADCVPARVAERDAPSGSRVRAHGWAFGRLMAVTEGIISGELDDELYLDIQCVRGMSGGPIVNERDEVVTLVRAFQTDGVAYESSPNGFTVGARTQYLRDLLSVMRAQEVLVLR